MSKETNIMQRVLSDIHAEDILYCVWKGRVKLDEVFAGTEDLDVLVNPADVTAFVQTLAAHQFFEVRKMAAKSDIGARDFFHMDASGRVFHIHIHTQIIFGNALIRDYHVPIEHDLLRARIWDDDHEIWCATPEHDQFLFLCRHSARKKNGFYVSFKSEYASLRAFYDGVDLDPELIPTIVPAARAALINDTAAQSGAGRRGICQDLKPFRLKGRALSKMAAFVALAWVALLKRLGFAQAGVSVMQGGGMMVAFVGIDGSGKSSALERYKDRFSKRVGIETISMGSGQSGASFVRRIMFSVFGTKAKLKGHTAARESGDRAGKPKKFPWYYQLWLIICLWEKRSQLRRGLNAQRLGKIVLVDRWLQTQLLIAIDAPRTTNLATTGRLSDYLAALEADIFRLSDSLSPDLMFVMDVSPENSVKRKPEDLTLERAKVVRENLLSIVWPAKRVVIIDANDDIPTVDANIVAEINKDISGLDLRDE
ncbi:hypothetical protein L0664_07685 [Octadecabacter sp. G9-8]|uniref:Thymidylate kinase n=1 Tax=Octadecabacter dasysiphoniae TaxID=2909341 RepID=A0ABS9CUN2_9RHOB|nr:hypothetical protein [Octadecabacter dasysiphoniae]MCF2870942.1 hypothetical protein [Octadecabacter dasysiphoniae]